MSKADYVAGYLAGFYSSGEGDNGEWSRRRYAELEEAAARDYDKQNEPDGTKKAG